jgi:hypothetical protein
MENLEKSIILNSESAEHVPSGLQTVLTERIKEIADTLDGSLEEKISGILDIVSGLKMKQENKDDFFRKRTADQILGDGFVTGCTDVALASVALLRAAGISSKYVEAIDVAWLKNGGEHITGHVYVRVFDGSCWRMIDPIRKIIDVDIVQDKRVVFKEGLDSWDIGINSFDSLLEAFNNFRNQNQLA